VQTDIPPVYAWLHAQDPGAVVAEVPALGRDGFASYRYEYMSTYHWHPLVNGGSGFEPPASGSIMTELDAFPEPSAVEDLRSLGVRFLVVHAGDLDAPRRQQLAQVDFGALRVRVAARFGDDVVYEFAQPTPAPPLRDDLRIDLPAVVARDETPAVTVTIADGAPAPIFVGVPEAIDAQIQWNGGPPVQRPRENLPVFLEPGGQFTLVVPADLSSSLAHADSAQLTLRLTGAVQAEATQTVRIVDMPTSLDKDGLSARIEHVQLPPGVRAGSALPIEVTARNTGTAIWLGDTGAPGRATGVVGVAVRGWTTPEGSVVTPAANSSAHVNWNVNPGQAAVFTIQTQAPTDPGQYQLTLAMLSENVTWFADVDGAADTRVPVKIEP
jgi:hypothetical protein